MSADLLDTGSTTILSFPQVRHTLALCTFKQTRYTL